MFDLHEQFGDIDIYLFDQLLKGRIAPGMRILDAGCGHGRNLVYLLRQGYEIFGVDAEAHAIESVRSLAASLAPLLPAGNFRVEAVEKMSLPDAFADAAISSAVLHFARDDQQFRGDGPRTVEGPQTVGTAILPACFVDWNRGPDRTNRRPPLSAARRLGALPGGRGDAEPAGDRTWRYPTRSSEDDRGSEPACDDHLGGAEGSVTVSCES